jgi:hypothetical protein
MAATPLHPVQLPFTGDKNQLTDSILNSEPKYPPNADPNIVAVCKGVRDIAW